MTLTRSQLAVIAEPAWCTRDGHGVVVSSQQSVVEEPDEQEHKRDMHRELQHGVAHDIPSFQA